MLITPTIIFVSIIFSKNVYSAEVFQVLSNEYDTKISTVQPALEETMNISKVQLINQTPLDDFPNDLFTADQRRDGAIIFHILGAIYFFVLLAVVCNDYFLPSVECVCEDLNMSKDLAAASFMAISTIAPEFFTNVISSFVVESDVGLGGVLGSLMFNILGVAAFAGMATSDYIDLDWWPITRDCVLFASSVLVLISFTWDGQITLFESTIMVSLVLVYILVLLFNKHLMHAMKWVMQVNLNCCKVNSYDVPTSFVESNLKTLISMQSGDLHKIINIEEKPKFLHGSISKSSLNDMPIFMIYAESKSIANKDQTDKKADKSLWNCPMTGKLKTMWWIYTWPIKLLLTLTIPNPKTYRRWYPLTFVMCVIWIGLNSYMIVWMMTVIGYTFGIAEAVMGMTFLAFGNCTPEALSSVLMIRKGERGVGVSNSLGSSTLDIFLSLGVPWFVRNLMQWNIENQNPSVQIASSGTGTTILLLLASVVILYVVLSIAKYRLSKSVGLVLILGYIGLAVLSVSLEMDVFSS